MFLKTAGGWSISCHISFNLQLNKKQVYRSWFILFLFLCFCLFTCNEWEHACHFLKPLVKTKSFFDYFLDQFPLSPESLDD